MKSLLIILILFASNLNYIYAYNDAVLLGNIEVLTFQKGSYTTFRRTLPVSQLICIGGNARFESDKIETIQCKNMGFDGHDYNWKCQTELPNKLRLGKVTVNCEGYNYPDDPYILVGSCGLEYYLEYNENYFVSGYTSVHYPTQTYYSYSTLINEFIYLMIFCVIFISFFVLIKCSNRRRIITTPRYSSNYDSTYVPVYNYPPPPSTVIIEQPVPISNGFLNGVMVGNALSNNNRNINTHTNTIIKESNDRGTHTSTSYGTTKRR